VWLSGRWAGREPPPPHPSVPVPLP
jgi:hypothetical protein